MNTLTISKKESEGSITARIFNPINGLWDLTFYKFDNDGKKYPVLYICNPYDITYSSWKELLTENDTHLEFEKECNNSIVIKYVDEKYYFGITYGHNWAMIDFPATFIRAALIPIIDELRARDYKFSDGWVLD